LCKCYQEALLKLVDEITLWRGKQVEERFIFASITSTLKYANRFFLEGGSFLATRTTGTGIGKPLLGSRCATLFRFEIFNPDQYIQKNVFFFW
jgi:hypothetical protein